MKEIDSVIEQINKRLDRMEDKNDAAFLRIHHKLEQLIGFRWTLLGASAAVSAIIGLLVTVYFGR